ncbi:MAG: reductive dehalogenase [Dehalococcoides mccartyi]|uniref:reductive dehalogenase n=1 Tax=Dehalococcoides mccartyi TaxID=61435 RepID=UPI0030F5F5B5|nr:reductive dehalogenase [uncultured bacterium]UZH91546.1 reductive dehalogenase [uncultured bacterium]UZH91570.1 reductive dehalogenase [uncultured bacterium]UZH91588.1 reductive dehalogenase [uncultured bacterium]UZH91638.1 reductive dehalogenase [uncultured bacterium]
MNSFHSTVSRRNFMKALGLAGAGIGVSGVSGAVFHDLDEVTSESSEVKHPWWIQEVDNPTLEVDWQAIGKFDARKTVNGSSTAPYQYAGKEEWDKVLAEAAANFKQWNGENKPGWTLRDYILSRAVGGASTDFWVGPGKAPTPESLGIPRWEGTPEENSRMLRSALKLFGASLVGYTELNENTRKILYSWPYNAPFKEYVIEDVDQGYETADKFVIPDRPLWVVSVMVPCSIENFWTQPSLLGRAATSNQSRVNTSIANCAQEFLRGLGYQCLQGSANSIAPGPAFSALSGLGEVCRNTQVINPHYGMLMRNMKMLTDLPLVPTKPIDAGIWRFCWSCRKCAEVCPSGALSRDTEPSWEIPGAWHNTGKRAFYFDAIECQRVRTLFYNECALCMSSCVFTKRDSAMIHEVIKSTVSTTSIFNPFFKTLDDFFGYGTRADHNPTDGKYNPKSQEWWDLELPAYGYDLNKPL